MSTINVVLDTNVIVAAFRSKSGASAKLVSMIGDGQFEIHLSVPLALEYEEVLLRQLTSIGFSEQDVTDVVDGLCALSSHHEVYFSWRPYLKDADDELVLELAISAQCAYIVTHNLRDFAGSEQFGIQAILPGTFLKIISEA